MNDTSNAKQKIVEKIKDSSNILVTVSTNPSVDELSAALGLTAMLNKLKKHATAVVSGDIPPAIDFLEPGKTFENSVDSLRDFIVALDKEKADHLRYKVEGEVVKIFITPYKTTIDESDLEFSQGDYNVELVLALGVKDSDNLDRALSAHGRILHDATVATLDAGNEKSTLGSIDWHDEKASSLSEMLVSLSEALKTDKPILDEQIATAFLTGIVAATDRFSNERTSSRVMTMAAQLMAAGANQQAIAAKLEEAHEINQTDEDDKGSNSDGSTSLSEDKPTKLDRKPKEKKPVKKNKDEVDETGALHISHEKQGDLDEVSKQTVEENQQAATDAIESRLKEQQLAASTNAGEEAAKSAEDELAAQLKSVAPAAASSTPTVEDIQKDVANASAAIDQAAEQPVASPSDELPPVSQTPEQALQGAVAHDVWKNNQNSGPPAFGGTLNATTEQAADDKRREEESDKNRSILSHKGEYVGSSQPNFEPSPLNGSIAPSSQPPTVDVFGGPPGGSDSPPSGKGVDLSPVSEQSLPEVSDAPVMQPPSQTLEELDLENRSMQPDSNEARAAVDAALDSSSATPQQPVAPPVENFAPEAPPVPPMPDFSTLPPLPGDASGPSELAPENLGNIFAQPNDQAPVQNQEPPAPGQFRIPGQ